MKIPFRGIWTIEELRTALYHELHAIEDRGANKVRGMTVYLNLVDDRGAPVTLCDDTGTPIKQWRVETLYHAAADDFVP